MITTHKLHHVVVLAEKGSFRRAAEALNLSQPALTRSIQSVERALEVQLFDRGHGAVEPTVFGRLVIDRARGALEILSELEREIDLTKGLEKGTLSVSLGPYPAALSGQRAVSRLLAEHPEIHCRVRVAHFSEVIEDVARGHCDIGIAELEGASERGFVTELLVRRQAFFLARREHPLVKRRRCTLDDLLRYPWASIRFPARMGSVLSRDVGRAGDWDPVTGEFVPALEIDQVAAFLSIACESDILVGTTLTIAENELRTGKLAVVPFSEPRFGLHYGFISRRNRTLPPTALSFMKVVREIEGEIEERETALRNKHLRIRPRGSDSAR